MRLFNQYARLQCKKCGHIAELAQCPTKGSPLGPLADGDPPLEFLCPHCNETIALLGLLGLASLSKKASVLNDEAIIDQ